MRSNEEGSTLLYDHLCCRGRWAPIKERDHKRLLNNNGTVLHRGGSEDLLGKQGRKNMSPRDLVRDKVCDEKFDTVIHTNT